MTALSGASSPELIIPVRYASRDAPTASRVPELRGHDLLMHSAHGAKSMADVNQSLRPGIVIFVQPHEI